MTQEGGLGFGLAAAGGLWARSAVTKGEQTGEIVGGPHRPAASTLGGMARYGGLGPDVHLRRTVCCVEKRLAGQACAPLSFTAFSTPFPLPGLHTASESQCRGPGERQLPPLGDKRSTERGSSAPSALQAAGENSPDFVPSAA